LECPETRGTSSSHYRVEEDSTTRLVIYSAAKLRSRNAAFPTEPISCPFRLSGGGLGPKKKGECVELALCVHGIQPMEDQKYLKITASVLTMYRLFVNQTFRATIYSN
jgi:hypothetical protein